MNYQELTQAALSQKWAADYKEKIDLENQAILAQRQTLIDKRENIGVGDFVIAGDNVLRVAHHWGDLIQLTDGRFGESFYLSASGHCDFSGGLNPGIPVERFEATTERRYGAVWFFSQNIAQGHNGFHAWANFRVWIQTKGEL